MFDDLSSILLFICVPPPIGIVVYAVGLFNEIQLLVYIGGIFSLTWVTLAATILYLIDKRQNKINKQTLANDRRTD